MKTSIALIFSTLALVAMSAPTTSYKAVTNIAEGIVVRDVPGWARQPNPPKGMTTNAVREISFDQVKNATNSLSTVSHTGKYNDLSDLPTIPDAYTKDEADAAFATKADEIATRAIVQTWEGFLGGSNVVFSITNYISRSYNLSDAKLRILEMTNGVYREVYNSRVEIVMHLENFKTNDFRVATNSVITAVNAAMSQKADKDWGKYTSTGEDVASVYASNTVWITEPTSVFAGGTEFKRFAVGEGSICVLTTRGAPVYTAGDAGVFKFQDFGGTNYFGFSKTDSYPIGCHTDGISVDNNIVTLTYNVSMQNHPCVWYKEDISSDLAWEQLNLPDGTQCPGASHLVQWEQNPPSETQICYINVGSAPKGFFKTTIEVEGESKFITNMPADLMAGIICTNSAAGRMGVVKPSYNGSTVTWTWSESNATVQ